jgi:Ca-activated chloride channel family protein
MRPNLARSLWILAAAAIALPGCGKSADKRTHVDDGVSSYDTKKADKAGGKARSVMAEEQARGAPMPPPDSDAPDEVRNTEDYTNYGVNPMTDTATDRLSTFAIDVDTASYAIARRKILAGEVPPADAVRVEEFLNYFKYSYAGPTGDEPFAVHMDAAPSPFTAGHHLLRVGVQAKHVSADERKPARLVFLVDVSGSMSADDKLGLAKRAMRTLVQNLKQGDTVALVTYAGNTRVVLEPTGMDEKVQILDAIDDLNSGGSTAMSSGLELAYDLAIKNLGGDSISRVLVLSDGDANVGASTHEQILAKIADKVKEGVTLSTVGFGTGNYKDTLMEQLANKGNGNYFYIDSPSQARRVFQEQLGGTLEVVAKDVKIQVELNPEAIASYRLVGYENRNIADEDFRDDKVDAGEIGAGHSVTALYEVKLADDSKGPLATVRVRAKTPRGNTATETKYAFDRKAMAASFDGAPSDFRFAAAVMATAEILRKSPHSAKWSLADIVTIVRATTDSQADRIEFLALLDSVQALGTKLAIAN